MIKAVTLLRRKSGMPVDEFQHYWRFRHAEVIRRLPGVRRYVQSHPLPVSYSQGEPVCDGVAELWADTTQDFRAMAQSDAYAAVLVDEQRFIDQGFSILILTDEHILREGAVAADGIKQIDFILHKEGMDIEGFQRYWREVYGPLVAATPQLRRYVQSHARLGGYAKGRTPRYDGFDSSWYDTIDSMQATMADSAGAESRMEAANFIAPAGRHSIVTSEYVIYE